MAKFGDRLRRPAGRQAPHSMDKLGRLVTTVRIEAELLGRLDDIATAHNVSRSALMSELVARIETGPDNRLLGPLLLMPDNAPTDQGELDMSA